MASLSLKHIYKVYPGGVRAVSDFNLDIDDKEFIVFVGPSGCGKSTTLRMIAGLEDISAGELRIDNRVVNDVEPKDRDIAMVFQNYALYPHMTVRDNMAFGLKLRHVPKDIIEKKVSEAAAILGIEQLLNRRPKALSGGQRQRVALGRAIVREPKVFLLDEPLSNLDAKLRVQMRTEITKIHHKLATTFIYVTHDQTEAMTMGTRIVVMKDGVVQQVDTPTTLYDNPANLFVACFLGSPQMNIFKAKLVEENGDLYALIGETNKIMIPKSRALRIIDKSIIGNEVLLGIRPEDVHYEQALVDAHPESVIEATIDVIENLGNETILYLNVEGKDDYTIARVNARYTFNQGDTVKLYFATEHAHLFDIGTELTLMGVPDYNKIAAQAVVKDGSLSIMFGDNCINLPREMLDRITDKSIINDKVLFAIAPDALSFTLPEEPVQDAVSEGEAKAPEAENAEAAEAPAENAEAPAENAEAPAENAEAPAENAEAPAEEPTEEPVVMKKEYISIEGVAEFYDNYPRFKAVYVSVPGMANKLIVAAPLDYPFQGGENVTVYLDPDNIQLFNCDGERIVADMPITGNTATGTVTELNNVYTYRFASANGKNKLTFENYTNEVDSSGVKYQKKTYDDLVTAEVDTPMFIQPRGVSIDKDVVAANGKMALSGVIQHLCEYHKDAIATVKVDGFDDNMTIIVRNFSGYNVGDKIKFAVEPHAIYTEKYVAFGEAIMTEEAVAEGEMRYKEIVNAREKEKELENAAKKPAKPAPAKEQAAAVTEATADAPAEEAEAPAEKAEKPQKAPAKKPAAKSAAAKRTGAKRK